MIRKVFPRLSPLARRMLVMLIAVGVVFGAIFGFQIFKAHMIRQFMAANRQPPVTVTAAQADYESWQPELRAVGSLRAAQGVDVTSEVAGIVQRVNFKSGDTVPAGAVLVQLDADADRAQLRALRATAELARTTYRRDREQLKVQAVSQATVDAGAADLAAKQAQADQQAALVEKKTIRAAFAGRLGISTVNVGQYINPGAVIVTLQALDSLYVDFYLPQQELGRLALGEKLDAVTDTYAGQHFDGRITALNARVDAATRNIQVEGRLENPGERLLPGMYVEVNVLTGAPKQQLTVPRTAITFNPYGSTVYVVERQGESANGKPALIARQRFVTAGETRGEQVAVLDGIKAGELVVTSGQLKLKNESPVVLENAAHPQAAAAGPPDS